MQPIRFSTEVKVTEYQPVIHCLVSACQLSQTELKRAMTCGAVWLKRAGRKTRRLRKASFHLLPGDIVSIHYDKALLRKSVEKPITLHNHNEYSLWYKPVGMVTQGTKYGDHLSLLRIAEQISGLHNRLHLIHRLDREACGVVVIAHNKRSSAFLSRQFHDSTVIKKYWAQVIGKWPSEGETLLIDKPLDNKNATTIVTKGSYSKVGDCTDLFVELKSGRYHQIRRHLAGIGFPLVGDKRYNSKKGTTTTELQLCAYQLVFAEPGSRKKRNFTLPSYLLPPAIQLLNQPYTV